MKRPANWPKDCKFVDSQLVVFDPYTCKYIKFDTKISTHNNLELFKLPPDHPAFCDGHGYGVRATAMIKADTTLGVYTGLWRYKTICEFNTFLFEVDKGDVDAQSYGNIFRFINDPMNTGKSANVYAEDSQRIIPKKKYPHIFTYKLTTSRDIQAGEELFMNYGDAYWEMLRLARDDARNQVPVRKKIKHVISEREFQSQFQDLFKEF